MEGTGGHERGALRTRKMLQLFTGVQGVFQIKTT